jgi:Na+:H+ antiporter, NhaA family
VPRQRRPARRRARPPGQLAELDPVAGAGAHATVAGALLGFAVPVKATERARVLVGTDREGHRVYDGPSAHFADRWEVISGSVAVPIFAFFSTGVTVGCLAASAALTNPIAVGIVAGLVVGKAVGITGTVALPARSRKFVLDATIGWADVVGMSFVPGIGFTVALLVGDLAYGGLPTRPSARRVRPSRAGAPTSNAGVLRWR